METWWTTCTSNSSNMGLSSTFETFLFKLLLYQNYSIESFLVRHIATAE